MNPTDGADSYGVLGAGSSGVHLYKPHRGKSRRGGGNGGRPGMVGGNAGIGPAWTYDDSVEKPAGTKNMGSWTAGVYTPEQQERLGVDEFGNKANQGGRRPRGGKNGGKGGRPSHRPGAAPGVCDTVYDPVHVQHAVDPLECTTYSNECRALNAGVDAADLVPGRCPIPGEYVPGCTYMTLWDPVCGSDGNTYSNSAEASCHQIYDVTPGACHEGVDDSCTYIGLWNPVCGSDGVTYTNSGHAGCMGVSYTPGECVTSDLANDDAPEQRRSESNPDCVCGYNYDPVITINYAPVGDEKDMECKQYANECMAGCDGVSEWWLRGTQRKDMKYWLADGTCPKMGEYIPGCVWLIPLFDYVCGINGVTYQNPSEARCNGVFEYKHGMC